MGSSSAAPPSGAATSEAFPAIPTPLERLKAVLAEREGDAIAKGTKAAYKRTFDSFAKWCDEYGLPSPTSAPTLDRHALAGFLWWKCMAKKNARTWSNWQAHICSYAEKYLRMRPLAQEDVKFIAMHHKACAKTVGVVVQTSDPVTELTLRTILAKARPELRGARLYMTFSQLVIAKACTTRPGELVDTGNGDNADRLRAKDVKFIEADEAIGLPACIELTLRNTKKIKLTGLHKATGERSMAAESSISLLCPVKAMRHIFTAYGLHDAGRAEEPVFARMRHDGSRVYTDPIRCTGATMISSREVNEDIATLCALAGIPRFTLRSTRHGSACDMEAAGATEALANVAGRWAPGSRPPYSHMTLEAASKIKDLFEVMRARYPRDPAPPAES